jgi:hypothetical protein
VGAGEPRLRALLERGRIGRTRSESPANGRTIEERSELCLLLTSLGPREIPVVQADGPRVASFFRSPGPAPKPEEAACHEESLDDPRVRDCHRGGVLCAGRDWHRTDALRG